MTIDLDVHEGLTDKTLRDFFMHSFSANQAELHKVSTDLKDAEKLLYSEYSVQRLKDPNFYNDSAIREKRLKIKALETEIKLYTIKSGLLLLMTEKGWSEHDISDRTFRSGTHFLSFIGTQEEYDVFYQTNPEL